MASVIEQEVSFFLRLINSRRNRRGDFDSAILESLHLHVNVPHSIEKASWNGDASILNIHINFTPINILADVHTLSLFVSGTTRPRFFVSYSVLSQVLKKCRIATLPLMPRTPLPSQPTFSHLSLQM
jgi:hypothetical protein